VVEITEPPRRALRRRSLLNVRMIREHMFVPRRRHPCEYKSAKELFDAGLSTYRVAKLTGIPVSTVRYWRRLGRPPLAPAPRPDLRGWRPPDDDAYCYLLGLYLGDGCVARPGLNPRLTISLDARYPGIVATAVDAIRAVVPDAEVCGREARGCSIIGVSHPVWMAAFPQHGPGRKHERPIRLVRWQRELTGTHPGALLKGLIHSDGSRVVNRFKTKLPSGRLASYEYVRYFFTNYSEDIRGIFCEHCDLLGIRWTQSSFKNISIANRPSVVLLDEFIGPKE
jgi:hypothetical protein